ncbi:hypothetical protein [Bradyrhizobium sp. USDA 4504]
MRLNHFFLPECAFKVPGRVYARLIEWNRSEYALFDAVDADWFDGENASSLGPLTSGRWLSLSMGAPVYAIEINSRLGEDLAALEWLDFWLGRLPKWLELQIFERRTWPG